MLDNFLVSDNKSWHGHSKHPAFTPLNWPMTWTTDCSFIFGSEIFSLEARTAKKPSWLKTGICIFVALFMVKLKHLFIKRGQARRKSINKNRIKRQQRTKHQNWNGISISRQKCTIEMEPAEDWVHRDGSGDVDWDWGLRLGDREWCWYFGERNGLQQARILVLVEFLPDVFLFWFLFRFQPLVLIYPTFCLLPAKCFHTNLARRRFFLGI